MNGRADGDARERRTAATATVAGGILFAVAWLASDLQLLIKSAQGSLLRTVSWTAFIASIACVVLLLCANWSLHRAVKARDDKIRHLTKNHRLILHSNSVDEGICQVESPVSHSENLAALGRLSAGVAHEFRNPLASLRGFLQLMRTEPRNMLYLDIMERELKRIEGIVNDFLLISKPHSQQVGETDPRKVVREVAALLEPQLQQTNSRVNLVFSEDVPLVLCNEGQLVQVVLNLLKNAIEAMPGGGTVTVDLGRVPGRRETAREPARTAREEEGARSGKAAENGLAKNRDRDELRIRISDEGVGMTAEQIARLGEPFFSTKEGGTGLGLAVCLQIVRACRGRLEVTSETGRGTHFEIRLPEAKQQDRT